MPEIVIAGFSRAFNDFLKDEISISLDKEKFAVCPLAWTPESVLPDPWRGISSFDICLMVSWIFPWTVGFSG